MKTKHVEGRNVGDIMLFALSTCGWCKKTKDFLKELKVAFDYVDVDLLNDDEKTLVEEQIKKWNPDCSFPTLVKNNKECIIGFRPDEIESRIAGVKL